MECWEKRSNKQKLYKNKKRIQLKKSLTDKLVYHSASITSITFSPSNKYLLSTSMDNGYYIWDTETFERVVEAKSLIFFKNSIKFL